MTLEGGFECNRLIASNVLLLINHCDCDRVGFHEPFAEFRRQIALYLQSVFAGCLSVGPEFNLNRVLARLSRIQCFCNVSRWSGGSLRLLIHVWQVLGDSNALSSVQGY